MNWPAHPIHSHSTSRQQANHPQARWKRQAGALSRNASLAGLILAVTLQADEPPVAAETSAPTAATTNAAPAVEESCHTLDDIFNRQLPEVIGQSRIHFQWRPRYEYADSQAAKPSQAFTMRTLFGLTTAEVHGFQAGIEALNLSVLGNRDAYFAGDNQGASDKTLVLDPPTTEINQAWLSYAYTNLDLSAKGGRQGINLDNQRFIGTVDWRQNPQTFDAVRLDNTSVKDLALNYTYIGRANRVGGNVAELNAPLKDFQSQSHVFHAGYTGFEPGRLAGYIYLLDLENGAGNANSCATYGLSFDGKTAVDEAFSVTYRAEFAWQTDYADMQPGYGAPYLHLKVGGELKKFSFGAGYELMGADNNVGFKTPLATLHAFNGWADVFLNTPTTGLQDLYVYATASLPEGFALTAMLHKFDAHTGGRFNYGNEVDLMLTRKFGKHWTVLLKYAYYDARNPFAAAGVTAVTSNSDVQKFWAQVDFKF